jgi:hypothetical protein
MTNPNELLDHATGLFPAPDGARERVARRVRVRARIRKLGAVVLALAVTVPIGWAAATFRAGVTPAPPAAPVACPPGAWTDPLVAPIAGDVADVEGTTRDDLWVLARPTLSDGNIGGRWALLRLTDRGWDEVALPRPSALPDGVNADMWALSVGQDGSVWVADRATAWTRRGGAWEPHPLPSDTMYPSLLALSSDDVWFFAAPADASTMEDAPWHWDGSVWTATAIMRTAMSLDGSGPGDVWAVGASSVAIEAHHWDGSDWSIIPTPPISLDGSRPRVVSIAPDDAWILTRSSLLHWDGTTWSQVDPPTEMGPNADLAAGPAGAWFFDPNTGHRTLQRWNGSSWEANPRAGAAQRIDANALHEPLRLAVVSDGVVVVHGRYEWIAPNTFAPGPITATAYGCGAV